MTEQLANEELRVLGCLLEKAVTTPEQYPLTLNALVNACNQKSSREPVMQLTPGQVQATARRLAERHLVVIEENFKSRVEKYQHRFCNTPFSDLQLEPPAYAALTLLFLRGAQTPGELRARSPRLHAFTDNGAVEECLQEMMSYERGALVVRLPKRSGRRDFEYQHCFGGELPAGATTEPGPRAAAEPNTAESSVENLSAEELQQRIATLEAELAVLKDRLRGS
ncbi:MAG: DUF480 domain-containing protein [Pseudomonadota bacterium]